MKPFPSLCSVLPWLNFIQLRDDFTFDWDRISLCSPGWPRTPFPLSPSSECRDCRSAPSCAASNNWDFTFQFSLCLFMCVVGGEGCVCACVSAGAWGPPRVGVTDRWDCELSDVGVGPLEEQFSLLTAETFLQTNNNFQIEALSALLHALLHALLWLLLPCRKQGISHVNELAE